MGSTRNDLRNANYLVILVVAARGGTCMGSGENKPQLRMSLKLDQEKPPKKKWLWRKIKEFFTQGPDSQYWKNRDLNDW